MIFQSFFQLQKLYKNQWLKTSELEEIQRKKLRRYISSLFQSLKRAMRNGYGTAEIFKKYWHSKDKNRKSYSSVIKADIQVIQFDEKKKGEIL